MRTALIVMHSNTASWKGTFRVRGQRRSQESQARADLEMRIREICLEVEFPDIEDITKKFNQWLLETADPDSVTKQCLDQHNFHKQGQCNAYNEETDSDDDDCFKTVSLLIHCLHPAEVMKEIQDYISECKVSHHEYLDVEDSSSCRNVEYSELLSNSSLVLVEDKTTIQYINEQIELTMEAESNERCLDIDTDYNSDYYYESDCGGMDIFLNESEDESNDSGVDVDSITSEKVHVGLNKVFRLTEYESDSEDKLKAHFSNKTGVIDKIYSEGGDDSDFENMCDYCHYVD